MWRVGIAIRRQLQRAETQNARRAAFMARLAVRSRRDAVAHVAADDDVTSEAALGREQRLALVFVPGVGGVFPAFRGVSIKRVSERRENLNSFQKRVPTGNCQSSGSDASMNVPAGSSIQRVLIAPSVHSGY